MRASIIIPQHGKFHLTDQLIRSMPSQESAIFELIIVDDGSPRQKELNLSTGDHC